MVVDGSSEDDVEDYDAVELPDSDAVPREDWGVTERRAELLQRIREAGHPRALNQTELGEEFGVSQQQISKDFARVGAHVRQSLDADRRALAVNATVQRAVRGLLDEGEYYDAGRLALKWDSWVEESGMLTGEQAGPDGLDALL
jgi:hypothetical protein